MESAALNQRRLSMRHPDNHQPLTRRSRCIVTHRTATSSLTNEVFLDRWSPRSFTAESVSDEQLDAVFEAARWAPSWMNNQPWIFAYDTDGAGREPILNSFMEFNRGWAATAPVVGLVLAKTELEDFMARTRDFDTGAAMMSLTLQATMLGLSVHVLGGVDLDAAYEATGADPATTEVLCGFVIGHCGEAAALPEKLQAKEQPSNRRPVSEIAFKGGRIA